MRRPESYIKSVAMPSFVYTGGVGEKEDRREGEKERGREEERERGSKRARARERLYSR